MPTHEWTASKPLRRGNDPDDWIHDGEAFTPTDAERQAFGDSMTQLSDGSEEPDTDESEGVCAEVKTDGEVCGRDRPCPYHDKR